MGISKTMQEIDDEQKEREEVARDSVVQSQMADAQQQQEMDGVEEDEEEGQQEEEGEEGLLGRDLDEDIPDADQEGGWVDDDDEDDDENSRLSSEEYDDDEQEEEEGDISQLQQQQGVFSMRPPGLAAAAAGLYGEYIADQEGDDDDGARDLDEDIPEAGSYQHTDTEVEDESSFDGEEGRSVAGFGIGVL